VKPLPLAMPDASSPANLPSGDGAPAGPVRLGSGPRRFDLTEKRRRPTVLLVDDDDDARALHGWCMRAAGWLVEEAANGEQALLKAVGCDPDVIILDLHMPTMDGAEVLLLIRQSASLAFVPVVLWTASQAPDIEQFARETGCAAFVPKPSPPDVLRDVVARVLSLADEP
jgi:CheY-like chemotaxis protein